MFERKQVKIMLDRIREPRRTIMIISGPRQCGKTTAVKQMLDKCDMTAFLFSADNVKTLGNDWITDKWEQVRNRMDAQKLPEAILVIDEVQKIDNWSEAVKAEWDKDSLDRRPLKVILLGSSRLLLEKGLEESLAGRYEKLDMTFWTYDEMHDAFNMTRDEYIYFGGFPGLYEYIHDETRWRYFVENSIISPFLLRDITELEEIRNPTLLTHVFAIGSSLSSRERTIRAFHSELNGGTMPTIMNYLNLLDKTMMLKPIFKFRSSDTEKYNSSPKMQVYNNAYLTANRNVRFRDVRENNDEWGQWVESAIGAFLLSMAPSLGYKVMYWREERKYKDKQGKTRTGIFEVDYILQKGDSIVAIEVKSNRVKNLSGINEFRKVIETKKNLTLTSALVVGNDDMPFEEFCRLDLNELFLVNTGIKNSTQCKSIPLSRLDKREKIQLELLGRLEGTVWIDGQKCLVQKNSSGDYVKMSSEEVMKDLGKNPQPLLENLGINNQTIQEEFALGHTLTIENNRYYYDIESKSIKQGISFAEAYVNETQRKGITKDDSFSKEHSYKPDGPR